MGAMVAPENVVVLRETDVLAGGEVSRTGEGVKQTSSS
jgi:hypothetical protein